ncbi:hypothetical protein WJX84_002335 [Apatococcus fuscideae]|uniref:MOSC domain-containing protein n=1 Tax=Apatococcus fuscideae TaxID=2026836 RepID=A0AAW1TFA7_9CHLO
MQDMTSHLYSNPHSQHGLVGEGVGAATAVQQARQLTLDMCQASAEDYDVIFTSGATGALKLVGEIMPWEAASQFVFTQDNHNSVLGIRNQAHAAGASSIAVTMHGAEDGWHAQPSGSGWMHSQPAPTAAPACSTGSTACLFAMPCESNFGGQRYDPHIVDFVALSYYKIFGYPTGLGALLVRRKTLAGMRKSYFGGGTVAASCAETSFFRRRPGAEGFEDGTAHFLGLAAVRHGFAQIAAVGGFPVIQQHTHTLTRWLAHEMAGLQHGNNSPVCCLYGLHEASQLPPGTAPQPPQSGANSQGPIVTFNVLHSDGSFVGHREVEKLATLSGILLRTGCFCNPGACALHLGMTPADVQQNFENGHACWDDMDLIDGRPTGAVRVSFGYMNTLQDAAAVVRMLQQYFVQPMRNSPAHEQVAACSSCPPSSRSKLSHLPESRGVWLLFDRHWALVNADRIVLTQKRLPALASLSPRLDLQQGFLELHSADGLQPPLQVHISMSAAMPEAEAGAVVKPQRDQRLTINICAETTCSQTTVAASGTSAEVAAWFRQAIGMECWLVQQQQGSSRLRKASRQERMQAVCPTSASVPPEHERPSEHSTGQIGFANEGQLLLVNAASLADINQRLSEKAKPRCADVSRFRPNLLVEGAPAFVEDSWASLEIGGAVFENAGPCTRCEMVCMDQRTGLKLGPEPLLTLASFRRIHGRIMFGILLSHQPSITAAQEASGLSGSAEQAPHMIPSHASRLQNVGHAALRDGDAGGIGWELPGGQHLPGPEGGHGMPAERRNGGHNSSDEERSSFPVLRVGMPLHVHTS